MRRTMYATMPAWHPIGARDLKALLDQLAEQGGSGGEPMAEDQILRTEAIGGTAAEFTPAARAQYGIPEIPGLANIWEHVQFRHPPEWRPGGGPLAPGRSYPSFEGEVSWEPEHGLQLVYEDG
jgi:hypothetical protein